MKTELIETLRKVANSAGFNVREVTQLRVADNLADDVALLEVLGSSQKSFACNKIHYLILIAKETEEAGAFVLNLELRDDGKLVGCKKLLWQDLSHPSYAYTRQKLLSHRRT